MKRDSTCATRFCRYCLMIVALLLILPLAGRAAELTISNFAGAGLAGWEPKSFSGFTEYRIVQEQGFTAVKAVSNASASGLVKKITFAPQQHRYLRWSWKIAGTIRAGDETSRRGDDYAARVYIVFPGRFFWQTRAINYIWANKLARGKSLPNVYTSNTQMLAVESGDEKAGQWLSEQRDLLADYRTLFGEEPQKAAAIAIMTDTDNTGASAEAWYGEISLSTEAR